MECEVRERWLREFEKTLRREERSENTVQKYLRDARVFLTWLGDKSITHEKVVEYKRHLMGEGYAPASINSMLAALNKLLETRGLGACRVRGLRLQRRPYSEPGRELSRKEYKRLLRAARPDRRLWLVLQAICATGIRVSELRFLTVEAVETGEVEVSIKGKVRAVLVPTRLRRRILLYAKARGIDSGPVFVTRSGRPLDRSNIWRQMKALAELAGVAASKVFPHNLRKLFARAFYQEGRDIAGLADVLGHSSINTTRIYVRTTADRHRAVIDGLKLVL